MFRWIEAYKAMSLAQVTEEHVWMSYLYRPERLRTPVSVSSRNHSWVWYASVSGSWSLQRMKYERVQYTNDCEVYEK